MNPLTQLTQVIRTDDSIVLHIKRLADRMEVIVQPQIADAATNDPTLAQLRALLSTPFYFNVAVGEDVDAALSARIAASHDSRIACLTSEEAYRAAASAAVEASRKAADSKRAAPARGKGKAATASVAAAGDDDDARGEDARAPTEAASTATPPAVSTPAAPAGDPPASAGASNSLFSDLNL